MTAPVEPGEALQPLIGDYALVGDTRTAALCSRLGSVDWLCFPRFDSEPVFGRLIDGAAGGWFSINPTGVRSARRWYRAGSGMVETRWETATGEVLLTEGMVLDLSGRLLPQALLVRRAECTGGEVDVAPAWRWGTSPRPSATPPWSNPPWPSKTVSSE